MKSKPNVIRAYAIVEVKGYGGRKGRMIKLREGPSICWKKEVAEKKAFKNYSTSKFNIIEVEILPIPQSRRRKK